MTIDPVEYLENRGWSHTAALGIAAHLDLETPDNVAHFRGDRLALLKDFCSMHERRPEYLSSQLAFISEDLLGAHHQIGRDLAAASSLDLAVKAAAPYFERVIA